MTAGILTRRDTTQPHWYESWFESPHCHALYSHRDEHEAAAFVDRLLGRLVLKPGSTVADLGCGTGRHARRLAAHGKRVLGIDLSETFIQAAGLLRERGTLAAEVPLEGDICEEVVLRVPDGVDRARARFRVGDAMELPADLGAFDLVLGANLVCRLPEPRRTRLRRLPTTTGTDPPTSAS